MFAKVFASLWKGSLRGDRDGQLLMIYACANCDADGVLDEHPRSIAEATGIPVDVVWGVCRRFCEPDPDSRSHEADGRRFEPLDVSRPWGWRIVNYAKYRNLRTIDDVREQARLRQRRYRAQSGSASVSRSLSRHVTQRHAVSLHAEAEAEVEAEAEKENDYCPDPVAFEFPVVGVEGESTFPVLESHVVRWAELYPGVDVRSEIRRALGWAEANPRRRKTPAGMLRFLNAWIAKAQNQAGPQIGAPTTPQGPPKGLSREEREALQRQRWDELEASRARDSIPQDDQAMERFERALRGEGAS